jgi:methionyl-tRNA formyltransferase
LFEAGVDKRRGPSGLGKVATEVAAGVVVGVERDELVVACGAGTALRVLRAQRAGRGPVSGGELARALGLDVGERLE